MQHRGDRMILIVDDDQEIRDALGDVLVDHGFRVATARDGGEALAYLRRGGRPCAILLDLWMPGMDGWRFRELLDKDPALADIPVIVVTASRGEPPENLRVAEVLTKPIRVEKLLDAVSKHVAR